MLANRGDCAWWYMEVPRTASTTIDKTLRQLCPTAFAPHGKHWPVVPSALDRATAKSIISIRNPYSRAVSCWQYFVDPSKTTFLDWLQQVTEQGFIDNNIEAKPQVTWFNLVPSWDFVLRVEFFDQDFLNLCTALKLPQPKHIPRWNSTGGPWVNRAKVHASRTKPWQDYYDARCLQLVNKLYEADLTALQKFYSESFSVTSATSLD